MKSIYTILFFFLAVSAFAQSTQTVNIIFRGINNNTKNYQVIVDGTSYFSNRDYSSNANQNAVSISNVATGKHTIKVYRLRNNNPAYNNRPVKNIFVYSKPFEVREGYDMDIAINVNGRVLFSEKSNGNDQVSEVKTPMSNYEYNRLQQTVRSKWSQALKGETVNEAFNNPNNYFSTIQIKQLLSQITSENGRVDLAKLSYRSVTDTANFTQVYDLFKMQTSKDELNNFLRSKGWSINEGENVIKNSMADNKFNQLLQTVRSKWSQALKGETESEAFNNPNNYFNTNQVRQLLILITSEYDRLDLAKLSYRAITDTANFTQLYNLFTSQSSKTDLNNFLISKGWNINSNGGVIITPMADYKFNQLLQTVRNKWSQALKGEAESEAFNNPNNYFSTNQIKQLLTLITSENDRLDLAKLSYRSVTDTANFIQLYDLFKEHANRDALNSFLNTKGWNIAHTHTPVKTPMTDADFNQLVTNVRINIFQFLKVNYETDVFNNPAYFFTTAQIRELLLLINSEENRLELAKLSYRTVTDPANFLKLSTILNSQSSRNELANYVKTYDQNMNIHNGYNN
ncbi:MAG: DUF4476 domain-containing protein [Bacteroidota bacterium]|nr:DUF4476 domain-containing protein [Bacteroidota bacterium]